MAIHPSCFLHPWAALGRHAESHGPGDALLIFANFQIQVWANRCKKGGKAPRREGQQTKLRGRLLCRARHAVRVLLPPCLQPQRAICSALLTRLIQQTRRISPQVVALVRVKGTVLCKDKGLHSSSK